MKPKIPNFLRSVHRRADNRQAFIASFLGLMLTCPAATIQTVGEQGTGASAGDPYGGANAVAGSGGTGGFNFNSSRRGGRGANGVIDSSLPESGGVDTEVTLDADPSPSTIGVLTSGDTSTSALTDDAFAVGGGGGGGFGATGGADGGDGGNGNYTLTGAGAIWTINGASSPINATNLTVGGGGGGGGGKAAGQPRSGHGGTGGDGSLDVVDGAQLTTNGGRIGGNGGEGGHWLQGGANTAGHAGAGGEGTMNLTGGAIWSATDIQIGGQGGDSGRNSPSAEFGAGGNGGDGTLIVAGNGTTLDLGGTLTLGGLDGALGPDATAGTAGTGGIGILHLSDGAALNTAGAIVINANGTLNIGGASANADPAGTIGGVGTTIANDGVIQFNQTDTVTISRDISGDGTLIQAGAGTTTLDGTNTFTGGITISQGTLSLGDPAGAGTGTITLGDANTGPNYIALLFVPTSANQTITNDIVVSSQGTGTATIGTTSGTFNNKTFSGSLTLNRATTLTNTVSDRMNIGGVISGDVGTLTIAGDSIGARVVFLEENTFAGDVVVDATGTLQLGVNSHADFIPDGSDVTVDGTLNLSFGGMASETINALEGSGTIGSIGNAAPKTLIVGAANGSGNFSGSIGATNALTKIGTGIQILSGANTYTGATTVQEGTLELGSPFLADASSVEIAAAATLALSYDATDTIDTLIIDGVQQEAGLYRSADGSGPGTVLAELSGTGKLMVTTSPAAGYDAWATQIPNAADRDRGDDPDSDGFTNLQEYLLGTSPVAANGSLTTVENTDGSLVIRWKELIAGATYTLQESGTLNNDWVTATGAVFENDGAPVGDYQPRKATVAIGAGARFFHVEAVED